MSGFAILVLIVVALAALDVAALRWGVDSRPGFDSGTKHASLEG